MNAQEESLVKHHEAVILEFLYQHAATLLPYMERQNVIDSETRSTLETSKVSDHDMVYQTFKKIKVVVNGWTGLIGFLNRYGGGHIATILLEGMTNVATPQATAAIPPDPQRFIVAVEHDLLQSPDRYPNTSKGLVMIINNNKFSQRSGLNNRDGSQRDYDKSIDLWQKCGYTVDDHFHSDLSAADMNRKMEDFAAEPRHAGFHSAVVVVMSHGVLGKICGKDGDHVDIKQFVNKLSGNNCPALEGKPKMFLFQACRERVNTIRCCGIQADCEQTEEEITEEQIRKSLSWLKDCDQVQTDGISYKDVIVGFSTNKGNVSYRNTETGTFYIQAICTVFEAHYKQLHIEQLLAMVGHNVAEQKKSQIATYEHNLRKKFYI